MANKFAQSIQQRIEQEAFQQKKKQTPPTAVEEVKKDTTLINKDRTQQKNQKTPPGIPAPTPQKADDAPWQAYINKSNQRMAKNKTFYLDIDVIDAIKSAAKGQHIPESKLVNDILTHILLSGK